MKIITKELYPIDGEASLGYNVDMGYYAQNQEDVLDKNATVFDTLDRIAVGDIRTKLRDILASFLFRGEDIDKKVAVLSGGERARLAMAKLMLKPHNLLALDEPTNHMDLISKDILKQALQAYDGTLVIVSHDRDFLDGLVNKVYEFRDGKVKEHLGGISDFLERKKLENLNELERKASEINGSPNNVNRNEKLSGSKDEEISDKELSKLSYLEHKEKEKEKRKKQNKIDKCEKEIAQLEEELKVIEDKLSTLADVGEIEKYSKEYQAKKNLLDAKMDEWIELTA